jgi:hypothetical protein
MAPPASGPPCRLACTAANSPSNSGVLTLPPATCLQRIRQRATVHFDRTFSQVDLLVTPTLPISTPRLNAAMLSTGEHNLKVGGGWRGVGWGAGLSLLALWVFCWALGRQGRSWGRLSCGWLVTVLCYSASGAVRVQYSSAERWAQCTSLGTALDDSLGSSL